MEVALDPPPGCVLGGDDTAGRGLDLLRLVLLHDDEPGLRGQVRQQAILHGRERLPGGLAERDRTAHGALMNDRPDVPARAAEIRQGSRTLLVGRSRPADLRHQVVLPADPHDDLRGADRVGHRGGHTAEELLRRVFEVR